jgi:hypothetical protein
MSDMGNDDGGPPHSSGLTDFFRSALLWGKGSFYREPELEPQDMQDYFTSPELLKIFAGQKSDKPIAVHTEDTGFMWSLGLDEPKAEPPNRHGMICTSILKGNADGQQESFIGYQLDADPYTHDTLARLASNPAVKLVTISSVKGINDDRYKAERLPAADRLIILAAAGNFGDDEQQSGIMRAAAPVHYAPGYLRVGEVDPGGIPSMHSNADGPAFMCENPLTKHRNLVAQFYPSAQDLHDFQLARDGEAYDVRDYAQVFPTSNFQRAQSGMKGTSFSTPEAGRMIMHYTADMEGIKNYDVIPAVLLAAQMSPPPQGPIGPYAGVAQVTNGAGLKFGTMRYGFGILKEDALDKTLKRVWDIRNSSPATKNGALSDPQLLTPAIKIKPDFQANEYSIAAADPGKQGVIVNTVLSLSFNKASGQIPLEVDLESPSGTKVSVPLIYKKRLGGSEAMVVTPAFFGEKKMEGEWKISVPAGGMRLRGAGITFETLQAGSPGAQLVDEFRPVKADPPQPRLQLRPLPPMSPRRYSWN